MMCADLHMHSVYSDGVFTPDELARRCREAHLSLFSITDHDNLGDTAAKRAAAEKYGLSYAVGWEVSSYDSDDKMHILGYGCAENDAYRAFLEERRRGALIRARDAIGKANALYGLDVTLEEVERAKPVEDVPLHTMIFVRAFAERLGKEPGQVYNEVFAFGKPAYSELCRPTPEDAIDVIHRTGGIAVLAHPGRLRTAGEERERRILRLIGRGLDGIECDYTTHTAEDRAYFHALAKRYGLYETGGSDFHADNGRRTLGQPRFVPDERLLERLGLL